MASEDANTPPQRRGTLSYLKAPGRWSLLALEATAALLIIVLSVAGFLLWRLSEGPVDVRFAREYIERALNDLSPGIRVSMDQAVLAWPDLTGPILLDVAGLDLRGEDGAALLSVDQVALGLSHPMLLIGQIRPVSILLENPALQLIHKDGDIDFFLEDQPVKKGAVVERKDLKQQIIDLFQGASEAREQGGALAALHSFEITNARVAIRDFDRGLSWYLTDTDFILSRAGDNLNASLNVTLPAEEGSAEMAGFMVDMVYRQKPGDFTLTAQMQDLNPSVFARLLPDAEAFQGHELNLSGRIAAALDAQLTLQSASVDVGISEGALHFPQEYDAPLAVSDIILKASYQSANKTLAVETLQGTVGGINLVAQLQPRFDEDHISIPIAAKIDDLPLEKIPPVFPKSEMDGEAALWLTQRLSGGRFHDVTLNGTVEMERDRAEDGTAGPWRVSEDDLRVDFAFEGVKVAYSDTLMPAEDAKGKGYYESGNIHIDGESAKIGAVTGRNANLNFTDFMAAGAGVADITLEASGPLPTVLEYIDDDPINMADDLGFDPAKVKGNIDMKVHLNFPTVKDLPKEDVKVKIDGTLTDVFLPDVVEGLELTGGPYALTAADGKFRVTGKGRLANRDIQLDWSEFFDPAGQPYEMQVKAQIGADRELRHHFGVDLDEWVSGTLPVDLVYTEYAGDRAELDITGDLNPIQIVIEPFKYLKAPGVAGDVKLKGHLQGDALKEVTGLSLKTQNFSLADAKLAFGPGKATDAELKGGTVGNAILGRTTMAVEFSITPENILKVSANGPVLDINAFMEGKTENPEAAMAARPPGTHQPMQVSATADRMFTKGDRYVDGAKLYIESDTDGDITRLEMDATAGKGNILVRFRPNSEGVRTFRMESADAGSFLYAFDLYENVLGGTIVIQGAPRGDNLNGNLFGSARMENFTVVKAPALAKLLSIMSLTGVQELLGNEGLNFSKLESEFEWRFQPGGGLLLIKNGRTSGSSLGLTFEGTFDKGREFTDIGGTIVPMTEINSILSHIPILGDLLTGGPGGGLIAATYTMRGPSQEPVVSVNPLSVLAPGFLRTILFEGGYDSKLPEEQEEE